MSKSIADQFVLRQNEKLNTIVAFWKEIFYMLVIVGVYFAFLNLKYSSSLSYVFQIGIVGLNLLFFLKKPVMAIPTILILNVLPNQVFYATHSKFSNHYQLNATMVFVMLVVLLGYKLVLTKKGKILKGSSFLMILPMVILMGISMFWAKTSYSLDFFVLLLIYLSFPFFIENEDDINMVWFSFCVSGALFATTLLPILIEEESIYEIDALADRNYLAMFGILAFMFLINFASSKKFRKHWFLSVTAIVVALMIIWLTLSFASRTAFILLLVFVALHFVTVFWKNKVAALLILVVAGAAIWMIYNTDVAEFLFERFELSSFETGSGRTEIAAEFIKGFFESDIMHQIMGHGYQGFTSTGHFAHNSYLGILLDFGVICFGLFIIVVIRILKNLWGSSQYKILGIAFIVFMLYMATLDAHTDAAGACFLASFAGISDFIFKSKKNMPKEEGKVSTT